MQILTAEQIKHWDAFTIENEPVPSLALMERASNACVARLIKKADIDTPFVIFCGHGNNGGDGLAIARLLLQKQYKVNALLIDGKGSLSHDCQENKAALEAIAPEALRVITQADALHGLSFAEGTLIIDALLGIGLNKPIDGLLGEAIDFINGLGLPVISIDIPSGLYADKSSKDNTHIVRSQLTLSFQAPKLAFMMAENAVYVPAFEVLDIGLHSDFVADHESKYTFVQKLHIQYLWEPRTKFAHKGTYGHALLIGGSKGKSGAIILAAKACLNSGAGLLTVHSCAPTLQALLTQLPEAMSSFDSADHISELPKDVRYTVAAIGPGLGTEKDTQRLLKLLIQNSAQPIVFDADAINILSENKTWLPFINAGCVFTPHVKEFDRLTHAHGSDFDRLETAIAFCRKHKQVMVLKGAYTAVISTSGQVYFNSTGNPALAKGGSGDVLTGIITGLIARGYSTERAAVIGVYMHGLAADLCIKKSSMESVLASDVIGKLGKAMLKFESTKS